MGKDLKEKYERVCAIKERAIGLVESQLNGNIENVDAKELGEVMDIAKDSAEIMKLCSEAEYYCKVTEAMDKSSQEEKEFYMDKYIPEIEGMYYTSPHNYARGGSMSGNYARRRDSRGRYMYTEPIMDYRYEPEWYSDDYMKDYNMAKSHMYYSSPSSSSSMNYAMRDSREGRSGTFRRTYMEAKEKGETSDKTMKEMQKYLDAVVEDFEELMEHADPAEKKEFKSSLVAYINQM